MASGFGLNGGTLRRCVARRFVSFPHFRTSHQIAREMTAQLNPLLDA